MTGDGLARKKVSVRGVVQGVGFRPFVYRLAHEHGLAGWVLNHSGGVEMEVEGQDQALEAFVRGLTEQAPPLARIVSIEAEDAPLAGYAGFEIRHSVAEEGRYQLISPDIATCADCRHELLDPQDRRYRYPFTNCTNCGPRFTIIRDIPYDRPLTTMGAFVMCAQCQAEYDDPLDRRFHAQPNACPICGPQLWLEASSQPGVPVAERDEALRQAGQRLLNGQVLAIKGLGGFHLACDATQASAVELLRQRKRRPAKPMAVMMATLDGVQRHCDVSSAEEALLASQQAPIVLLRWRSDSDIARSVAPNNHYLGVMLPYTPLHHVLLHDVGRPLVMTSGNLSEEPIAKDNDEARQRLGPLVDAFLLHNRDIYARYDDSVLMVVPRPEFGERESESPYPIRRSRGYAPFPIRLPFRTRPTVGVGPELKNTFCLARDDFAFLSPHIGDMENLETMEHFERSLALYQHLFRVEPQAIAHDMHPDYLSTRYATACTSCPTLPVQHHEAHVAACLVDNGWSLEAGPAIGVAWDGTGYGRDGRIWGGEFFVGDYRGFQRVAHLEYLPMPGGEAAIHHPWRLALGYLYALTGEMPSLPGISEQEARIVRQQVARGLNTPLTSAVGRLFAAVAALAGVRHHVTYEAQAAIELEMLATAWAEGAEPSGRSDELGAYSFELEEEGGQLLIRLRMLMEEVRADLVQGRDRGEVGWRFHRTLSDLIVAVCQRLAEGFGVGTKTIVLTGGCFQNHLLLSLAVPSLVDVGFRVLLHKQTPCNDGCVSLGQVALAHLALPESRPGEEQV
jgi:hydrogenase maturation protein HypF